MSGEKNVFSKLQLCLVMERKTALKIQKQFTPVGEAKKNGEKHSVHRGVCTANAMQTILMTLNLFLLCQVTSSCDTEREKKKTNGKVETYFACFVTFIK